MLKSGLEGKYPWQEQEAVGHLASTLGSRGLCALASTAGFLLSMQRRTHGQGMMSHTFRMGLFSLSNQDDSSQACPDTNQI